MISIVQQTNFFTIGAQLGTPSVEYNNALAGGNFLLGFCSYRTNNGLLVSPFTDSQGNSWISETFPSNAQGQYSYGIGYAPTSTSGLDTVTVDFSDNSGFIYDTRIELFEISGATSFTIATTNGTGSVASGTIATPHGSASFSTVSSIALFWSCNMVCVADGAGNSIVFAHPYNGVSQLITDNITGWTSIFNGPNDNLYIQSSTQAGSKVQVFISVGNTRTTASYP